MSMRSTTTLERTELHFEAREGLTFWLRMLSAAWTSYEERPRNRASGINPWALRDEFERMAWREQNPEAYAAQQMAQLKAIAADLERSAVVV